MYLNILKKDLKRKRAMNVILLVFITLSTMFISSSVNNIGSVTTALDTYFETAGVPDYFAIAMNTYASAENLTEVLENAPAADEVRIEEVLYMLTSNHIMHNKKLLETSFNFYLLQSDRDLALNYFLEDGSILENVPAGQIYLSYCVAKNEGLEPGDKITIELGGINREFTFAGSFRAAVGDAELFGFARFVVNAADFDELLSDEAVISESSAKLCYLYTADLDRTLSQISDVTENFIFACDREMLKFSYLFDMLVTGVLLIVSLILILISFVVLRFTITFTLSEEFREIGVMKAIGIRSIKIRGLYLTKYAALSIIGAALGLVLSFPFGRMLMDLSSKSVMSNSQSTALINVVCAFLVPAVILLFCLGCTGKVNKMTPIDAVRNGQTGERFRKKSLMKLGRSRLGTTAFLAVNDIVSSPRRYSIITLTFFLCMSLLIILSNCTTSLTSKKLLKCFHMAECHLIIDTGSMMNFSSEDGRAELKKYLSEVEQTLAENGMPAECMQEFGMYSTFMYEGQESRVLAFQGTGTTMDMYEYTEGTPPQNSGEIALTTYAARALQAKIGDTVIMSTPAGEREYIVTALYQSMHNSGVAATLYSGEDINYTQFLMTPGMQIRFTDNPDDQEIRRRMDQIRELFPEFTDVKTAGEWVKKTTGVADAIDAVKKISAALTIILAALITVLMERSFIAKEKAEIALMKAVGMRNSKIYAHHTARFLIVVTAAAAAAELLGMPLTKLCFNPVFRMMGLEMGVEYVQSPVEIYILFPTIIFAATIASAFFTSLYTRKIKPSDTANIE